MPQPLASPLGPMATEANVVQPAPASGVREIGDRHRSQKPIFGESTRDKMMSATGSSSSNHKHRRSVCKGTSGSQELASRPCRDF